MQCTNCFALSPARLLRYIRHFVRYEVLTFRVQRSIHECFNLYLITNVVPRLMPTESSCFFPHVRIAGDVFMRWWLLHRNWWKHWYIHYPRVSMWDIVTKWMLLWLLKTSNGRQRNVEISRWKWFWKQRSLFISWY